MDELKTVRRAEVQTPTSRASDDGRPRRSNSIDQTVRAARDLPSSEQSPRLILRCLEFFLLRSGAARLCLLALGTQPGNREIEGPNVGDLLPTMII